MNRSMIQVSNLTFTYPGAQSPTLRDINFEVEKGDFLAIVGNNGCGKSTLCKSLNGLIPHFITGEFEGSIKVDGIDTLESDIGELAKTVGYVYQDFENQIVRPTVLDDASYECMNYAMKDYKERGRKALEQCGLSEKEQDYIWQLSGGQTHLLALAGAVSLQPEILVLDEPIAQLDPQHADRIYQILKQLNEQSGKTIIVIEHHTEYIADYCKHVMLLKDGHVEWTLPARDALCRVEELQNCNIYPPQVTIAACELDKKGQSKSQNDYPVTIEEGGDYFKGFRYHELIPPKQKNNKMTDVSVSFEKVAVSYRADIAFAMQSRKEPDWEERTQQLLTQFRLESLADRDGRLLSGGQMRRASLVIGIALKPEILLMNEPTANLDIATRKEIIHTLQEMKDITDTVMIATHDMQLVCEWAERILVLYQGRVVADGTRDEIFGNEEVTKLVGIRPPEIFTMGKKLCSEARCYTVSSFVEAFGGQDNDKFYQ